MIEQQFGSIELPTGRADAMMCVDPDEPNEAMIYWWGHGKAPEALLVAISRDHRGILHLSAKNYFRVNEHGNITLPTLTESERTYLISTKATLSPSRNGFRGVWQGPGESGKIRFNPKPKSKKIEATLCETWDDFKNWATKSRIVDKAYCYRGHGDNRFELKTSYHRIGRQRLERFQARELATFHDLAQAHLNRLINLKDGSEHSTLLALAQHHGLPTPLLDVTRSPYIAAFFAFSDYIDNYQNRNPAKYVRVFAFSQDFIDQHSPNYVSLHSHKPIISRLRVGGLHNPRLSAQQGEFLVTNVVQLESAFHEIEESWGTQILFATDIPVSCAASALEDLSFMGLTAATLFPGLDGAGRMIRHESYFKGALLTNSEDSSESEQKTQEAEIGSAQS